MRMIFSYVKSLHGNLVPEKCVFLPSGIMPLMLELQDGFKQPELCSRSEEVVRMIFSGLKNLLIYSRTEKMEPFRLFTHFSGRLFCPGHFFPQCHFLLCSIYSPDFPFWNYIRNSSVFWHCSKPRLVHSFPGVSMTLSLQCQGDVFTIAAHSSLPTS